MKNYKQTMTNRKDEKNIIKYFRLMFEVLQWKN